MSPTRTIVEILLDTLVELENSRDYQPDDPNLIELKRTLVRTIAQLDLNRDERAAAA